MQICLLLYENYFYFAHHKLVIKIILILFFFETTGLIETKLQHVFLIFENFCLNFL
jgi:hypothetical protein